MPKLDPKYNSVVPAPELSWEDSLLTAKTTEAKTAEERKGAYESKAIRSLRAVQLETSMRDMVTMFNRAGIKTAGLDLHLIAAAAQMNFVSWTGREEGFLSMVRTLQNLRGGTKPTIDLDEHGRYILIERKITTRKL